MSLKPVIRSAFALLALLSSAPVVAQEEPIERGSDRFFFDAEKEADPDETDVDGSITSSSFYFRESGREGPPVGAGDDRPAAPTASPTDRMFTDLRLQLDAQHIAGSSWYFRGDLRGRAVPDLCEPRIDALTMMEVPCPPSQSGTFGGTELEAREFYLLRDGEQFDISVGRQFVLELAAVKFDGVKVERSTSDRWKYIGFAGAYPARSSRDLRDDYPRALSEVDPITAERIYGGKRIIPVVGGVGAAYRLKSLYGAFGVVGILPLAEQQVEGGTEPTRLFATANGYFRYSNTLDFYHYLVLDATGPDGAGLTNLTLGVNFRPKQNVRTYLQVNRIDTETLNVTAERRLESPDETDAVNGQIQNNIEVLRIAQESVRTGLSVAFARNRFDVSVLGALRSRPEIAVPVLGGDTFVFPAAKAADLTLRAVDRRSWKDLRLGASVTRTFGLGDVNADRASSWIAQIDGRREVLGGRGDLEANVSYIQAVDENRGAIMCGVGNDPLQCFGTARSRTISAGALLFWRPKEQWYLVGSGNVGLQKLVTVGAMGAEAVEVPQPNILMLTAFLRLAYRF